MDSILFSADPKTVNVDDAIKHLRDHKQLYWSVGFSIVKRRFHFPLSGFIHIKGYEVDYKAVVEDVIPFSREHFENRLLAASVKPDSFRQAWDNDPRERLRPWKSVLVMTDIIPVSISTSRFKLRNGRLIRVPPQKYARVIPPDDARDSADSGHSNVSVIHMVCNRNDTHGRPLHVRNETATHFISGFWPINKEHLRQGVIFALHRSKNEMSFLQGTIEGVEEVKGKRVELAIRKTSNALPWVGKVARGRAYEHGGAAATIAHNEIFVPPDVSPDALRQSVMKFCKLREGQEEFRKSLLAAYEGRCAVTGCTIELLLEAAHILPYKEHGKLAHHVQNGLLLRADIHVLFDRQLITFHPLDGDVRVEVSNILTGSAYEYLNGQKLYLPSLPAHRPSNAALNQRTKNMPKL
jgi:hypothetical protein